MSVIFRPVYLVTVLVFALQLTACSFSDSSGSFSKSSGSISDSVSSITSSPSESSKGRSRYQNDIADFTRAYVKSATVDADLVTFQNGLADIAARKGVVNWELDPETYIGIGRGLKKARLSKIAYETYKKNFADGDYHKMQDIQKGFDEE